MTKHASDPGPLKAYELVMAFAARRGEAALRLAMHAALPQVLRSELLHLIRLNFLPEFTYDLAIEADVLFTPFCEDIGNGYYCFTANARLQLLQGLDPAYPDESMPRSVQVARFMLDYLDHEERTIRTGSDRLRSDWIQVERWSALAFAEPALAAGQLAAALARATANDDVAARVRIGGLTSALSTPLARFGELLTYAEGVDAQQVGRVDDAHRLFDTLPDREIEIAGVRLKPPRRVFAESMRKEAPSDLVMEPTEQPRAVDEASDQRPSIVGNSPSIRSVVERAKRAAESDVSVLLFGEIGAGKELFARSIHQWSHRRAMPFTVINCAALPETLLENELFGHEQGAFSGADRLQKGKLEMADGGTVFLDEIGDMSLPLQAKLVRVVQDREFHRMGGTKTVSVNIRIIAATNKDLRQVVRAGHFLEDLYFRLNVISLTLPSLRERPEDIPALAQFFLDRHRKDLNRPTMTLSTAALDSLTRYPWPGNIRELDNVIARTVGLCRGDIIEPDMLGLPKLPVGEQPASEQTTPARDQIYISYSHRDVVWCRRLMNPLNPLIGRHNLSVWSDQEMSAGEHWEGRIMSAVGRARLAVVLLSPHYLASDFLMQHILPQLVERARLGDLRLTWVCVQPCSWDHSPLRDFQAAYDPNRPLSRLKRSVHDAALMEIVRLVASNFDAREVSPSDVSRPPSPGRIFIGHRHGDTADVTGRIYDRLVQEFGKVVFRDVSSMPLGVDFRKHLDEQIAECDVFIVVIGPDWMGQNDIIGKTRLDDPRDFMRLEIESALKRRIPIIPVLVRGAKIPTAEWLPPSVRNLSYRHGLEVRTGPDFHPDMDRLITLLKREGGRSIPSSEVTPSKKITASSAREFANDLKLPDSKYGGFENVPPTTADYDAQKNQACVAASDILLFMKGVTSERRQDIVNSSLLAQLVANKQVPDKTRISDWYQAYHNVLQNIGWIMQDYSVASYTQQAEGLEMHEAALKAGAIFVGPAGASLSLMASYLEALKLMDTNNPWITIFDRETKFAYTAHFQIMLVEEDDNDKCLVSMMAFSIRTQGEITKTLFIKIRSNEGELQTLFGRAAINSDVLTSVRERLKKKLAGFTQNYIAKLPDLY